jgi:hypothetical protein
MFNMENQLSQRMDQNARIDQIPNIEAEMFGEELLEVLSHHNGTHHIAQPGESKHISIEHVFTTYQIDLQNYSQLGGT